MNTSGSVLFHHFQQPLTEEERSRHDKMEQGRLDRLERMRQLNHELTIHEAFEREGERLRQERVERSKPKEVKLTNPRWQHVDQNIQQKRPDSVYIGDTITHTVDQEGAFEREYLEVETEEYIRMGILKYRLLSNTGLSPIRNTSTTFENDLGDSFTGFTNENGEINIVTVPISYYSLSIENYVYTLKVASLPQNFNFCSIRVLYYWLGV